MSVWTLPDQVKTGSDFDQGVCAGRTFHDIRILRILRIHLNTDQRANTIACEDLTA